jgi:hypothetical protein
MEEEEQTQPAEALSAPVEQAGEKENPFNKSQFETFLSQNSKRDKSKETKTKFPDLKTKLMNTTAYNLSKSPYFTPKQANNRDGLNMLSTKKEKNVTD